MGRGVPDSNLPESRSGSELCKKPDPDPVPTYIVKIFFKFIDNLLYDYIMI